MKRTLAILLAFAMILSLMPSVVLAQEQTGSDVGMGQIHVEGTNSFGMLISDGITQALEETENGQAGYGITGLEVNGNTATVTYDTLEEAVLVVAIYTEDGTQLLTTGKKTVTPEETKAMVTLPEFQEPYFLAEAFLLDIYDYSPLCRSFDTPMYTSDMQKLLDSTVEDYDPERVFQLSEDKTTNFAVFTDGTVIIEAAEGYNTLVSADDQNYQYIFENANGQITGLTAGTTVAYLYGEEEMLLFKVASVSTEGTTATVTGAQMEVQEIFSYMKLENSGDASQIDLDASTADAGVTFVGMSGGAQTRSWEGEATKTLGYEYSIDGKYENEIADGKVDSKVEMKGSLIFTLETKMDYYISLDRQFVKFEVKAGVALGVEVAGELNINALKLGDLTFSPVTGVNIGFEPQLKLGFSGKISFSTKASFTMGMQLEHRKGGHFTVKNLCKSSKPETSVEFEGEIFFGIDLHPTASIVSDEIAKLELTGLAGVSIKGKLEKGVFDDEEPTEYMVHGCELCLTGEILAELKIGVKLEFLDDENLSYSEELVALRFKLADFYYSYDHGDLGWGECPHYEYQIRVLTLDEQVNTVGGVTVTLSNGTTLGKTNKNGLLLVYLPEGNYTFRANIGGQPVVFTKYINYYGSVTLTSNADYWAYLKEMEKLQIQPDSALTTSARDSGTCGDDVSWTLYESGLLRLTGSGDMDSYNSVTDTPWEEYWEEIKSVHVSGDVTSVGAHAFYGCINLEKVILDDRVVHLGNQSFYGCTALKQVKLPVDLATEGAFYSCGNVEKIQYSYGSSGKMAPRGADNTDFNYYSKTLEYQNSKTLATVIFEEDITEIADKAFYYCSALSTVKLPASLESIGADAFYGCTGMEDISLPEGLEHLGERCFLNCKSLKEITIPSTVSQIPQSCFSGCSALTELELPPTVTQLGDGAFHGCTGLTKVSLPVDLVTDSVFSSTGGVTQIHYTYGSTGVMAQRSTGSSNESNYYTRTLEYYNRERLTTVTFDEGISSLANRAFYNCSVLTTVKLPTTLRTVGDEAFYNCAALKSIHLPKVTGLGEYSFSSCKSLTGITLPSTLTVIPRGCFQNCVSMTELILPDVVTSLGEDAFAGCTELVDVTLPVDLITNNAFGTTGKIARLHYTIGCTGKMADRPDNFNATNYFTKTLEYANREKLTTVIFDAGITTVANRAFYNCVALTSVTLPSSIHTIGDQAFYGCSALKTLKLPKGKLTLGSYCFSNCTALASIPLPEGLTALGTYCFSGCKALASVNFPSTLDTVSSSAFANCTALTQLEIPKNVTTLKENAFQNCTGLTQVTIPVDLITDNAFAGTGNVTQIHYTYGNTGKMAQRPDFINETNYHTRTLEWINREKLTTVTFEPKITTIAARVFYNSVALTNVTLPTGLTAIGEYAFAGCTALESILLPEGLTALETGCFSNCKALASVNFPSTLTAVPCDAFNNCTALTQLEIPKNVTTLAENAFQNCTGLTQVTIPVDLITDNAFTGTGNVTQIHYTYGNTGEMAQRPDFINGTNYHTRTLEWINREKLTTVIFDAGITTVANLSFSNCVALTSVTLPSSIHTIGDRAFNSCTALKTLKLPKGKLTLGSYCFSNCTALASIPLPEGLTALGTYCFSGCKALASVNFPSTLDTVSSSAFANCTALTQLEIPKNVTTLKENAFQNCTGLTQVTIPVDLITDNAFTGTGNVTQIHYTYGNTGKMAQRPDYINGTNYITRTLEWINREKLTTVTFDPEITTVANRAFYNCVALTDVTLPTGLTAIGQYAFTGCAALESILLPEGLTALETGCFSNCKVLASVNFPSTLTAVPSEAFNNCTALTQLEIPKNVTTLAENAFQNCTGLTQVTIPVDLITDNAFKGTGNVTQIHYTYGNTGEMAQRPDFINGTNYHTRTLEWINREKLTAVTFDVGITTVADRAFYNCVALTSVTFRGDCPSIGQSAFNKVTATVYYPQGNETYLPDLMGNYGGTLTWVPYEPVQTMSCEAEAVASDTAPGIAEQTQERVAVSVTSVIEEPVQGSGTVQGSVVQREAAPVNQVYDGTNRTEFTQDKTAVQVSSFTGLVPGEQYLMLAVVSLETEDLLAADNLLFIDQGVAAEDGTLTFRYVQRVPTDIFYVFVCGASDQNLEDAQVVLPEMTANGAAQALRPSVSYDGKLLVEEVHYIITEGAVYTDGGTYTATIRGINQYSGTKTFSYTVAAPAASTPPTITLKYPTVSFEDEIVMNIYYAASNLEDVKEMGLITYTSKVSSHSIENAEKVIPGYTWSESDGFYFSTTAGIAAKDLGDTIYFAVYAKLADGTYTYTNLIGYSPKTYAYNLLKSAAPEMKTLVAAMLNYGAAAQSYFNYKTDALVNADMTDAQKALVAAYNANMIDAVALPDDAKKGEMVNNGGYKNRYPTISFEGAFCINYYFVPSATPVGDVTMYVWNQADFNAAKSLSKSNATKAITMTLGSNGAYAAVVDGIAAKDLDSGVYVAFCYSNGSTNYCSGVIGYSIGAYCKNQTTKTDTMGALAAATAVYAYYAKQLFA